MNTSQINIQSVMMNFSATTNNSPLKKFEPFSEMHVIFIGINSFTLIIACYLSLALGKYMLNQQRIVRRESLKERNTVSLMHGVLLRRLCVIAAVILMMTTMLGNTTLITFQFFPSVALCNWISRGHHVLRSITEILFNTILWLRQKIFYQHPAMGHLTSKTTSTVSWIFYILMLISTLLSLLLFVFGYNPELEGECQLHQHFEVFGITEDIFFATTVTLIVIYRLLFLGLLLYPLAMHKRDIKRSQLGEKPVQDLMKVICRVLMADLLCIMIFIVVAVLTNTLLSDHSVFLLVFLWEAELVLGFVFIMLSFIDWKKRLLPFCFPSNKMMQRNERDASRKSAWTTISIRV